MADHRRQPLSEHQRQPGAFARIVETGIVRIDVARQAALAPQVVEGVLEGREDVPSVDPEALGEVAQEAPGERLAGAIVHGLVGEQRRIFPHRLAVAPPEAVERPARQRLARIPLALPEVREALRRIPLAQAPEEVGGAPALARPQRLGVPFGAVRVVERDEGRLAAHGQAHVAEREIGVDALAEAVDGRPLRFAVGFGDARRLVHARHRHAVLEAALAFVGQAADRCGRRGLGRTGERNVPFAGEQARGRIEADPAGARQKDFAPGVQVGEVALRAGGAGERLDVGHELDQIAGNEARGEPEVAQDLHQQPGRVAARPALLAQRLFRRLHAGLQADHVADGALHALVERDEEVDAGRRPAHDAGDEGAELRPALRGLRQVQIGLQFVALPAFVFVGEGLGVGFEEEIEGIDHRHLGPQIDLDAQFARLFREDEARQIVGLRVLLPVDEMRGRRDLQRIGEDRRARVRRRAQADDLRRERDRAVVAVMGDVVESDLDGHSRLQRKGYDISLARGEPCRRKPVCAAGGSARHRIGACARGGAP